MQYLYDYTVYKEQVSIKSAFDVASARLDGELRERQQVGHSAVVVAFITLVSNRWFRFE